MGLIFTFNIIPLSVLDTIKITTPVVSCDTSGNCKVSFSFTNANATSSFLVYMKVVNSQSQTVWLQYIQVSQGTAGFPINALPIGTYRPGAYIFSIFAISSAGTAISQVASTAFNVSGNYKLQIAPVGPLSGSVTPSCSYETPCSYPVGQKVTITYAPAPNYKFAQWTILPLLSDGRTGNSWVSKDNPLSLTMNADYEVILDVIAPNAQFFIVTPIISATGGRNSNPTPGTLAPSSDTKIYQDSAFGQTSAEFTASPNANYTFSNWQTNNKNFTGNPLTLRYTDLKPLQTSGQTQFYLYAYFKADIFRQLGVGAYPGITTTPAPKVGSTYTYPDGEQVTISITKVDANVCFSGWIVDGNDKGTANSITVTMDNYHYVYAQGFAKPSEGCEGGGNDGVAGSSNLGLAIGIPMMIGGSLLTFFGKRRR